MAEAKTKENKEEAKKVQALDDAIKQIEKKYGKGSVMKLGDRAAVSVDVIPTGSLTLDLALGILKEELLRFTDLNLVVKQH